MRLECPYCRTAYDIQASCIVRCGYCNGSWAAEVPGPDAILYCGTDGVIKEHRGPAGELVPEETGCVYHYGARAAIICSACGKAVCRLCAAEHAGRDYCRWCLDEAADAIPYTANEDPERHNALYRFGRTLFEVILSPTAFFRKVPSSGGDNMAAAFGTANYAIFLLMPALFVMLSATVATAVMIWFRVPALKPFWGNWFTSYMRLYFLAGLSVLAGAPLLLFFEAFFAHLGLIVVRGARKGFPATLKAVSYSSATLWILIPGLALAICTMAIVLFSGTGIPGFAVGMAIAVIVTFISLLIYLPFKSAYSTMAISGLHGIGRFRAMAAGIFAGVIPLAFFAIVILLAYFF